jgi:hypothetical protein
VLCAHQRLGVIGPNQSRFYPSLDLHSLAFFLFVLIRLAPIVYGQPCQKLVLVCLQDSRVPLFKSSRVRLDLLLFAHQRLGVIHPSEPSSNASLDLH